MGFDNIDNETLLYLTCETIVHSDVTKSCDEILISIYSLMKISGKKSQIKKLKKLRRKVKKVRRFVKNNYKVKK